ncbi:MAG: hypothetical protein JJ864_16510 [Rhizobiaceae bacterium]|nr:hypothetical protein [Rhizobiaceae bacterium]
MRMTKFGTGLVVAMALLAAAPASAGKYAKERIYDDSFGNLIILSPSGHKRIVVGMGHIAVEMEQERRESSDHGYDNGYRIVKRHCYRPPHIWKGRGYMYGLADGEIPQAPLVCK